MLNDSQVKAQQRAAEQQGEAHNPLGLRTFVGCLAMTAGTYVISGGGSAPRQFRIISGDVSSLKGKLGHTVKVVGIIGKNDALANQNGLYTAGPAPAYAISPSTRRKFQRSMKTAAPSAKNGPATINNSAAISLHHNCGRLLFPRIAQCPVRTIYARVNRIRPRFAGCPRKCVILGLL
jgi:hypothetical protein